MTILLQCIFFDTKSYFFNKIITNFEAQTSVFTIIITLTPTMRFKFLRLFIISAIALVVAACGSEPVYRIGISQCSDDDWRKRMNEEIRREVMCHDNVEVEIRSADDSNEKQIEDIRYFADNGFDIIIAAPNEAKAITPVIDEVFARGIPVIIFDRSIESNSFTAFQGADNVGLGRAAARYAHNALGSDARIIELHGLEGSTPAAGRHTGFRDYADSVGTIKVIAHVYANWNYEDAAAAVDTLLDIYPEANTIYAHNDRMAIAASDVARKKGRDLTIIGIDGAPEIGIKAVVDSVIDATFIYPTEGDLLVQTALKILNHQPFDTIAKLPLTSAVDLSNADILLVQNRVLQNESSKIELLKEQVDTYLSVQSTQKTLLYAVVVILILLFGFVFLLLRTFWQTRINRQILVENNRLLEEQRDSLARHNQELNEATQSKLAFFTNVSHDLRTPLTLISEPVQQLVGAKNLTPQQTTLMQIANKNVRILNRLINQILDFRKYENDRLTFRPAEVNIADAIGEWTESFHTLARKKDIKLVVETSDLKVKELALDVEKFERVIFNLLSNAFKFTPANGTIELQCSSDEDHLIIKVSDTGTGISAEDLPKIFDRFYQADKVHSTGSGIGLWLSRAFIDLHGGTINAESIIGRGTTFTIIIPVRHEDVVSQVPLTHITQEEVTAELAPVENIQVNITDDKPLILIIDDNEDILNMGSLLLGEEYNVITARNGKEGIRLASKYTPDLIICDVMMPVMDGLECCRLIKEEVSTSHIPVLMLTACSMDEQRVQGYESGADGYLSKPFAYEVIKANIRSLIQNRKRIKNLWLEGNKTFKPTAVESDEAAQRRELPQNDLDSDFYNRFLAIFKAEMSNSEINVDNLASKMGLGRSQFYRKIKALTNYSPVELIRRLRLQQARHMLTTSNATISEIAYEVGFTTPAYFTKCYRDFYGETPSELRQKLGRE